MFSGNIEKKYTKWFWKNIEQLCEIKPECAIYVDISVFGEDRVETVEENLTQMFIESHMPLKIVDSNNENIVAIFLIDIGKDEFGKERTYKDLCEERDRIKKDIEYDKKRMSELEDYEKQINKAIKKKREEEKIKCKDEGANADL